MRRVLMIAYYFPPLGGIGSIRASKFARYLPAWGWDPTIVTPANAPHPEDPSLQHDERCVIRTRSFELSRFGKSLVHPAGHHAKGAEHGTVASVARRFAHRYLYFPDAQVGWYPFALRAARDAMVAHRYDAIFSSSFPVTSHLVARRLQRTAGVPWVAEFRDPWADAGDAANRNRRQRLELALIREADTVVTVSPTWAAHFRAKGARRTAIVTNGFDPADVGEAAPVDGLVVTHLGSFYPALQDLEALWAALTRLRLNEPSLRLRLRFIGDLAPDTRHQIAAFGLEDTLEVTGFLPQRAALAALAASSVLVLGGPRGSDPLYRGFIPAKVFEYLGTALPIVYVGAMDGDAAALLAAHPGCFRADPGDVEGVFAALSSARSATRRARDVGSLTRHALAGALARVLDDARETATSGMR